MPDEGQIDLKGALLGHADAVLKLRQLEILETVRWAEYCLRQLSQQPKLSEWRLRINYSTSAEYQQIKNQLAKAEHTVNQFWAIAEALRHEGGK